MAFEDSTELQFKKPALCLWPLASPLTNHFTLVSHCYLENRGNYECFPSIFSQIYLPRMTLLFIFFRASAFLTLVVLAAMRSWIYLSEC